MAHKNKNKRVLFICKERSLFYNCPPGHGGTPPGHGGTPPGHGGTPPGHGGTPPGHGGTPPGHGGTPPGHGGTPPGHRGNDSNGNGNGCKHNDYGPSFGLINSAKFIANALNTNGIEAKVVVVTDNNRIDKEVHDYKPTHVFIEALWVVPSKIPTLIRLYPNIKWYVRIHSKIPFLAHEGMAIGWLRQYGELSDKYNKYDNFSFSITANNLDIIKSIGEAYGINIGYSPNIYCPGIEPETNSCWNEDSDIINIGCFGAIRPMKNQLYQALASIIFGDELDVSVRFHINSDRVEQKGESVLHNLEAAFRNTNHELIKHPWQDHEDFIKVVKQMDIGAQVSLTESFNIVAADFVWNDVPVVGSNEISWLSPKYQANPTNIDSILEKLYSAYEGRKQNKQKVNLKNLIKYNNESFSIWLDFL